MLLCLDSPLNESFKTVEGRAGEMAPQLTVVLALAEDGFSSQLPHWAAHNLLLLHLQGSWVLFWLLQKPECTWCT